MSDAPVSVPEVDHVDRITKQARGILEYGNRCWLNGFASGFTLTCMIPLAVVVYKVLHNHRCIMHI